MSQNAPGLTAAELIRSAAANHLPATIDQLHRWCRVGVMPRPHQRSLGRGQGTVAVYPPGAERQLLALRRLLAADRNVTRAGLALWWQGYPVAPVLVRQALTQLLERWEAAVADLSAGPGRLSERAWDLIDGSGGRKLGSAWLKGVRKRIGPKNFDMMLHFLLRVVTGQPMLQLGEDDDRIIVRWDQAEWKLIEQGLGLTRARQDAIAPAGPWLSGSLVETLQDLGAGLRPAALRDALAEASDPDLATARDEFLVLCQVLSSAKTLAEALLGEGALGLGAWPVIDMENPDPRRDGLLLAWLSLRHLPYIQSGYPVIAGLAPVLAAR